MKNTEWNLNDIYATEEDLQRDWELVEEEIEKLKTFEGKLNTAKEVLDYLTLRDEMTQKLDKIYLIRYLKKDEDVLDAKANKEYAQVESLLQKSSQAQTFFDLELLQKPQEFLDNLIANEPALALYRIEIEDTIKSKAHYLSKEAEDVLVSFKRTFGGFASTYDTLIDGDLKFDDACDSSGEKHKVSEAELMNLHSSDRVLREETFKSLYREYKKYAHTITKLYLGHVTVDAMWSKVRKYSSFFEAKMENSDSSVEVYDSVIKAVNDNLSINHKYYELKKKLLGFEKMYQYDRLAPIVPEAGDRKYSYDEAKQIVLKAVEPLGKEYTSVLKNGFESNWAHVYPKENKASGAYSFAMYGTLPYVLLNFTGILDDVEVVAHEFGHAMHSYYSNNNQPYATCGYSLMVAEVASTTNEILLSESLLKDEKDLLKRANYLQTDIERFNSTIIRQTMFAEFEKWVHEEVRRGRELTCEEICDYYGGLVKKYFGEAVEETDGIQYEWARISHFYTPFYVYKYATGLSAAICIVENISEKGEDYAKQYIEMLKMGGSIRPLDQLRSVGVDLETDEPIKKAFMYYERKINELEKLMEEFNK